MKQALIIFGTTTGNTEAMATIIKTALDENGVETEMKNVTDASVTDLSGEHNIILLGCPAYGDDDVELQEDFVDFHESMDDINLKDQKFAVFAPGNSSYEYFCGSVDFLEEKLKELGGTIVTDGLKIDGDPDEEEEEIYNWGKSVSTQI